MSEPPSVRTVSIAERRARLGWRHRFEPSQADSVEEMTDLLVVLHATDPATIYLSVGARLVGSSVGDVDRALFERRTLYRTLAMRRTLFVTTLDTGVVVEASSADAVAVTERRRLEKFLADTGIEDPTGWLASLFDEVLAALDQPEARAEGRSARALTAEVPRLATRMVAGLGTRNEVEMAATSRVLGLMAVEGHLVRGRPGGGWTARRYQWHRRDRWLAGGAAAPARPDEGRAAADLVAAYLGRFGPATLSDIGWWTGWTKTKARAALSSVDVVAVDLEDAPGGEPGFLLAGDVDEVPSPAPWAALLPSLDPTPMGWKHRSWYLGPHRDPLFDRNGNIGPTVWVDGRIVGGWSQRPDGEVTVELLEDVGADHRDLIEVEKARIQDFVGSTVVRPSFPTPLQTRLSGT